MKKIVIFIGLLFSLVLYGCGSTSNMSVDFDKFSISVDPAYKIIDAGIVENKQIKDKVVKSYKISNKDGFDENFIVTKTQVNQNIDSATFAQESVDKIASKLSGYKAMGGESYSFTCGSDNISGKYNYYKLSDNIVEEKSKDYYITQYYFKTGTTGYILSFASTQSDSNTKFVGYIKTLKCK